MIEYIRDIKIIDDGELIETTAIWELPDCSEKGICGSECYCAEEVEEMGEHPCLKPESFEGKGDLR